jgi:hypothetical protein
LPVENDSGIAKDVSLKFDSQYPDAGLIDKLPTGLVILSMS